MRLINNFKDYPETLKARIADAIKVARPKIDKEIGDDDTDFDRWLMKGGRFHDDDRITYGVCGEIGDPEAEVSDKKIAELTEYTIRDFAGADYWYHYEKEWD